MDRFFFSFLFFKEQLSSKQNWGKGRDSPYTRCPCQCTRVSVPSHFSRVQLFVTPWTVVGQAPLSLGFLGQNTGMGCHALLQGSSQLRNQTLAFTSPALAGGFFATSTAGEASPVIKAPLPSQWCLCCNWWMYTDASRTPTDSNWPEGSLTVALWVWTNEQWHISVIMVLYGALSLPHKSSTHCLFIPLSH